MLKKDFSYTVYLFSIFYLFVIIVWCKLSLNFAYPVSNKQQLNSFTPYQFSLYILIIIFTTEKESILYSCL